MDDEVKRLVKIIHSLYEAECFVHRTVNGDFYDCFDLPHYKEAEKVLIKYGIIKKTQCISSVDDAWCTDNKDRADNEDKSDGIS
jgi:hypothetical protein